MQYRLYKAGCIKFLIVQQPISASMGGCLYIVMPFGQLNSYKQLGRFRNQSCYKRAYKLKGVKH